MALHYTGRDCGPKADPEPWTQTEPSGDKVGRLNRLERKICNWKLEIDSAEIQKNHLEVRK